MCWRASLALVEIVTHGGADMPVPVRRHPDPDAGAANQNAAPGPAVGQRLGKSIGEVGVVDRSLVVCPEIKNGKSAPGKLGRQQAL